MSEIQLNTNDNNENDIVRAIRALSWIIENSSRVPGKLTIEFKILREGAREPVRKDGNAGWDLFVPEETVVQAGQTVKIPLGFACKLPIGYYGLVNVRSSTWENYGIDLTNQTAIFDWSFCGDEDEYVLSVRRPPEFISPVVIPAGARIAQLRLAKNIEDVEWVRKETLGQPNRGGFGSPGK